MTLPLALLPFHGMDEHDLTVLATQLAEKGFACTLLPEAEIPAESFDPIRRQYRAERLLEATRSAVLGRVLGLVDRDLYGEGLNFVFGMADNPGLAAVISPIRQDRMVKEAVHELGHTLGLPHCPRPSCVMHFSISLADTDRKGAGFCPQCRSRLAALGFSL
jgi:archaemetzincin